MSNTVRITVPELLTTREAARLLNLHPETVRDMLRNGRIKGVKTGDGRPAPWKIPAREVQRVLAKGARAADEVEVVA